MKKSQIVKKILLEKERKKSKIHTKKWERCFKKVSQEESDEAAAAICTSSIGYKDSIYSKHRRKESVNPKMKKGELMEYINSKKTMNEQRRGKIHIVPELNRKEFSVIVGWLEKLRDSGVINMFGCSPMLNWTKDDLHRWLYGRKMDLESIEEAIEELEYENEDGENDSEINNMREQAEIIEYLLEKKQAVRDVLIRAALKRIDRTNGDHETRNVQKVFEKMAKEAWLMWTSVVYG
jgi:hypothetical protein